MAEAASSTQSLFKLSTAKGQVYVEIVKQTGSGGKDITITSKVSKVAVSTENLQSYLKALQSAIAGTPKGAQKCTTLIYDLHELNTLAKVTAMAGKKHLLKEQRKALKSVEEELMVPHLKQVLIKAPTNRVIRGKIMKQVKKAEARVPTAVL